MDQDVLDHKKMPEDVQSEAMNIINMCLEGSGAEVLSRAEELQLQFEKLSQNVTESSEMCEEATSEMQAFQERFDSFSQWLKSVECKLEERRKTKQPIGSIGIELEDHYVSEGGGSGGRESCYIFSMTFLCAGFHARD